jgi:putative DNA primase/helicase
MFWEAMLGEDNIAAVELKELNDRFKTYQLEGKLANIGDDISKQFIEDNSTFKKISYWRACKRRKKR